MATIPGLAISNRCQVWRLIVKQLLADKLLASTGVKWQVGNALDDDKTRFSKAAKIAITLQPKFGNSEWYSFEAQRGPLVIQVTMEIEGYDVEDPMNLWLALCRACYPLDSVAREKFRSALVNQSIHRRGRDRRNRVRRPGRRSPILTRGRPLASRRPLPDFRDRILDRGTPEITR